jgi:hypothetical protein
VDVPPVIGKRIIISKRIIENWLVALMPAL